MPPSTPQAPATGAQEKTTNAQAYTLQRSSACRNCFTSERSGPNKKTPQAQGMQARRTTKTTRHPPAKLHASPFARTGSTKSQGTTGVPSTCNLQQQAPGLWLKRTHPSSSDATERVPGGFLRGSADETRARSTAEQQRQTRPLARQDKLHL